MSCVLAIASSLDGLVPARNSRPEIMAGKWLKLKDKVSKLKGKKSGQSSAASIMQVYSVADTSYSPGSRPQVATPEPESQQAASSTPRSASPVRQSPPTQPSPTPPASLPKTSDTPLQNDTDPWTRAYDMLRGRQPELMEDYMKHLASVQDGAAGGDLSTARSVESIMKKLLEDREKKQWQVSLLGKDVKVREQVEKLAKFLLWSDPFVKTAVSAQPYAALAWSGVSLLLPVGIWSSYSSAHANPGSFLRAAPRKTRPC